VLCT
jgi:hypothetical protein